MSNKINRAYPGALSSARGDSFLTTFNGDREKVYDHCDALEASLELLGTRCFGKGILPGNTATCSVPASGTVNCAAGMKCLIGAPVETAAELTQSYTPGSINYVFLSLATTGVLSLRTSTSPVENANDCLIASISALDVIDNAPAEQSLAKLVNHAIDTQDILYLTDGVTAPSAITGVAQIYVDTADGDLKVKFGDGTVTVIAADT